MRKNHPVYSSNCWQQLFKLVQNCAKCAKSCKLVKNPQILAKCAILCKICKIMQNVQNCAKSSKSCKMCKFLLNLRKSWMSQIAGCHKELDVTRAGRHKSWLSGSWTSQSWTSLSWLSVCRWKSPQPMHTWIFLNAWHKYPMSTNGNHLVGQLANLATHST